LTSSIFWKYLVALSFATASVLGGITALDFYVGGREAREQSAALQYAEARALSSKIGAELKAVEVGLAEVLNLPWVAEKSGNPEHKLEEIRRFLKIAPLVTSVELRGVDKNAALLVSRTNVDGIAAETDASEWRNSSDQAVIYGPVTRVGGARLARLIVRSAFEPSVSAIASIDLRFIDRDTRALKFGRSGEIYVVNSGAVVVAHPDARFSLRETDLSSEWQRRGWSVNTIEQERLRFAEGTSPAGINVMASATRMASQNWWLVAEQDRDEALEPVNKQLKRNLALFALGMGGAACLAFFLARKWSSPIVELSNAAKRMADGRLDTRVHTDGKDEFKGLANNFNAMASELQSLTTNLEQKIAEKSSQLEKEFVNREAQSKEIVKLEERARIMRDFHDGVGGHLVGLLGAAKRDALDAKQIEAMVSDALVDFRIAIDSLSPEDTDLTTALAGLRFRLMPRLKGAGLESEWSLEGLPLHLTFSREIIFHVQRIVAEAITNVIKHAGATRVEVVAGVDSELGSVVLEVCDDGVGFPVVCNSESGISRGRGVANISQRAKLVGGEVSWRNLAIGGQSVAHGTVMRLQFPIAPGGETRAV
jgi:signal transduction histidine kinase